MIPNSRPTCARYVLLVFLGTLAFILYLDRVCIGKADISIRGELGISKTQMGFVFGAFTIAYGLFEVATGRWGDRYGSRGVLTRIVIWWSAFTALTGAVPVFAWNTGLFWPWRDAQGSLVMLPVLFDSFLLLVVVRFLFGAGEAGALPNNARVVARWFPLNERGLVQGVVLTSMQLGAASSSIVAGWLIANVGWRNSFAVFGAIGVVWAVLFHWWYRDDPAEHRAVNDEELQLIRTAGATAPGADEHPPIPWRLVLSSPTVWLLGIIMNCGAFVAYMYISWLPTYLQEGRGVEEEDVRWMAALVLAGGAVGAFCGGWLSGRIDHWTGERCWGRRLMGFAFVAAAGFLLGASVYCESPLGAALCAAAACAFAQSQQANWWSAVMSISGRHLGALFGLMNSMGVVGAFLSPIFFGRFVDWREGLGFHQRAAWDPAFFLYAGVLVVGGCCWLFVNPTRSVVGEDSTRPDFAH
jgi:MFS family permease